MVPPGSIIVTAIAAITITSESINAYRILGLFPLNTRSHFVINRKLMKILAQKGHQVDVISHYPLKEPFPNYNDYSLQGSVKDYTNNLTHDKVQRVSETPFEKIRDVVGNSVCELLKHPVISNLIANPPSDPPYDLVIVEFVAFHCYLAFGRHLNVPMIGVTSTFLYDWTSEPLGNPTSLALVPSFFSNLPVKMNFWERLQNVWEFRYQRYRMNSYMKTQKKYIDENFGLGYPSLVDLSKELSLVFVNSYHAFNGVRPMTPGVVEIGGLHIEDAKLTPELEEWLDESTHGCVYVSFGSMITIESYPKETLQAFYATFRNIAPVRVLMKIANKEKLLPGLPNNVKVEPWLPQTAILKHKNVKVFMNHGGLMGTLESIYYGVPMVGLPLYGDQIQNMNSCERMQIAVVIDKENVTETSLTEAMQTVLNNPKIRSRVEKFSRLYGDRPMSPQDTAIYWTEYVIKYGNILRSPAADLEWWQLELLDIYGFLLFAFLLSIYIVLFVMKHFFRWFKNLITTKDAPLLRLLCILEYLKTIQNYLLSATFGNLLSFGKSFLRFFSLKAKFRKNLNASLKKRVSSGPRNLETPGIIDRIWNSLFT